MDARYTVQAAWSEPFKFDGKALMNLRRKL